jgi:hypothetical protein
MSGVGRYTLGASSPAWQALSGGAPTGVPGTGSIDGLAFDLGGRLYAAVIAISGSTQPFYVWNGSSWASQGNFTGSTAGARGVSVSPIGNIYVFGDFTTANGVTLPEQAGLWNGSTVVPLDIDMPSTQEIYDLRQRIDGTLIISRFGVSIAPAAPATGTSVAAGLTTATNDGTAATYPTLTITGPPSGSSRIYQIVNITTNTAIYFNYTINAGEIATLVLDPQNLSFTSTFRGNIYSTILPGSQTALFALQPGENSISFFAGSATTSIILSWQTRYSNLNDALYQAVNP